MPLEIKFTTQAEKFLEKTRDRRVRAAIDERIAKLANDPFSFPLSKPLRQRTERTSRVGDYRILFTVEEDVHVLLVASIGHRKNVYDQ